MWKNKYE
jgi:hypothetical protein